jgi:signal transduction histidine kinase/ActR/RegA family two-component response regulator
MVISLGAAIGFFLAGLSLLLKTNLLPGIRNRHAGDLLACLCILGGAWTIFRPDPQAARMSFFSALNFIMIGFALLWLDGETSTRRRPAQYLAILTMVAPGQALLATLYRINSLDFSESLSFLKQMSVLAAAGWFFLSIGTLFARPASGVAAVFTSATMAGRIVRRLLVPALLLPSILGWFIAHRTSLPLATQNSWASFLALSSLIIFVYVLWKNGIELYGVQAERDRAEENLKKASLAAEAANRTKSTFLANMSHEIRSPVGVMMGFADLLADPDCPLDKRQQYAQVMRRNGQALLAIIDDILDLSKVEAGKLKIQQASVHLPALIQDVAWVHQSAAKEKGIEFGVHWEGKVPECIISDPVRLRQILTNVLSNAIKFTSQGSVQLFVKALDVNREKKTAQLCFEVADTGSGINPEHVQRLFQPFVQGDPSVTPQHGGSGLGLALSKRLVKALNGDLVLRESTPEKGSVFRITLTAPLGEEVPAFVRPEEVSERSKPKSASRKERLKGLRILLVDDAADNRTLLKWILDHEGAIVDLATNGREAIDKAMSGDHDVVLMDIQMPVMDGLTAAGILRKQGYGKPIFALTAHAMKEDRERSILAGLNDHISKPVQKEPLVQLLCKYLPRAGEVASKDTRPDEAAASGR